MLDTGKLLLVAGIAIALTGAVFIVASKTGFKGLPGDINYSGPRLRVYFPIVTCIVLSLVLSGLMWLWRWLSGR